MKQQGESKEQQQQTNKQTNKQTNNTRTSTPFRSPCQTLQNLRVTASDTCTSQVGLVLFSFPPPPPPPSPPLSTLTQSDSRSYPCQTESFDLCTERHWPPVPRVSLTLERTPPSMALTQPWSPVTYEYQLPSFDTMLTFYFFPKYEWHCDKIF